MGNYSTYNKNYRYLLTVIDTFSKFAWGAPLKTKTGPEVVQAMDNIFKLGRIPKNLQTDDGKEFFNKYFKKLMDKHNINHYSTFSRMKASIVERFNRTLKGMMWKEFSFNGSYYWLDVYKDLIDAYNNKVHRTIKLAPINVNSTNEKKLLNTVYNNIKKYKISKFNVGDYVRISKYKHIFEKGYTPNWTTEIFKIKSVKNTFPTTYLLEDYRGNPIEGGFYDEELSKTKYPDTYLVEKVLKTKGEKVFVKWLGFSNQHNSWINKQEVL
ncbi:putative uncharacterized transposon-derived protein F54H12.3 [Lucilia cuprina]|nr:putative uncharacterized transposon-derived protein F54H12.3 [Lucilia cuprina]